METTKPKAKPIEAKRRPMKVVGKKYANVSDLVRDTSELDFAAAFETYQSDRLLITALTVIRGTNEVTQTELAERMRCAQSKVSKMEASTDADLNVGDVIEYVKGLNQSARITFTPVDASEADPIRFHLGCIKHELAMREKLAIGETGDGLEAFAVGQVQAMVKLIEATLVNLPHRDRPAGYHLSVDVEGKSGLRVPIDVPRVSRRTKKGEPSTD